jgi:release factor glutamine methyltransferase
VATVVPFVNTPFRRAWRAGLRMKLALIDRRRYERTVLESIDGLTLVVLPDVFNPRLLRSGELLARQATRRDLVRAGSRVLDLGCGSGSAGIAAARAGSSVTATDINPSAVRCTRINGLLNNVELDVRLGDLFETVPDQRFDAVLFNPPYYRGHPRDGLDHAWRSANVIERFASELGDHLEPGGLALLVLSSDGERDAFLHALRKQRFTDAVVAEKDFVNEHMSVHQVTRC